MWSGICNLQQDNRSTQEAGIGSCTTLVPDQIILCGAEPAYVKNTADLKSGQLKGRILLVANAGVFALGQAEKEAELAALLFLDANKIAVYTGSFGGAQHMTDDPVCFIVNREAEVCRQNEAKG